MTTAEKLATVKTILDISDNTKDELLTTYLDMAKREILAWRYADGADAPEDVPAEYEPVQIQAVVNGYTQSGSEGQTSASENGITRRFEFADMVSYIRAHVIAVART